MLKAYSVTTWHAEASVIVFAPTVARAKSEAHGTEWLADCDWTELSVKRQPTLDGYAQAATVSTALDFSERPHAEMARSLGWYELIGSYEGCAKCGLCEWTLIPESKIGSDGLCTECNRPAPIHATKEE